MTAGCQTGNVGNALNSQTTPTRSQCPLELHFQQPARPVLHCPELLSSAVEFTYLDKAVTIEVPTKDGEGKDEIDDVY